ncbi:DUF6640 family protein [Planococcus salinus]|uniref:Uncharacterized protein n=1 Tax=Planococcus salinus TaxID=1848460 RepID=A0A3M8PEM0_9BACL|nr:DUF6640 family protein [Planococcus salinus]RNF41240.1 hypothetical protein EEX84_02520 [Planococcus salinus]
MDNAKERFASTDSTAFDNPSRPAPQQTSISTGKVILGTVAALTAVGGFLADWNKTHLFNPNWPPHAKFHDAWTITLGSLLGGAGMYFLFRESSDRRQDLKLSTLLPGFFWAAQSISYAYPGAKGLQAEFPDLVPRAGNIWIDEKFASAAMLALLGYGYFLEQPTTLCSSTKMPQKKYTETQQ